MPVIRSAKKKLRQEKKRTASNRLQKSQLKALIKKARLQRTTQNLQSVFSALDKATKTNLIHKNKASRLKSRLSKGTTQTTSLKKAKTAKTSKKKVVKKAKK